MCISSGIYSIWIKHFVFRSVQQQKESDLHCVLFYFPLFPFYVYIFLPPLLAFSSYDSLSIVCGKTSDEFDIFLTKNVNMNITFPLLMNYLRFFITKKRKRRMNYDFYLGLSFCGWHLLRIFREFRCSFVWHLVFVGTRR